MRGEFSHYDILDQLGAGGMGEVYRARDRRLGREVALKILPAHFAERPLARERFLRESKLAAQISHPNIATVFDADEVDGQLFYAMELVSGDTLQQRVRPGGLSPEAILELAVPLAEGLAEAHRMGIVHRDLKPGNVMVDENGRLRILDFGLSRQSMDEPDGAVDLTQSGDVLGTPQYMSPEQVRGQKLDARSDLFSLGTMLYELATGIRPFFGTTHGEVMEAVLSATPPPIQRANPRIGDELARVVARLLEKDRDKRMQTADDLLAELRAMRDDVGKRGRTQWAWWITGVAVAAAATVIILFAFPSAGGGVTGRPKIAVLPFESRGATQTRRCGSRPITRWSSWPWDSTTTRLFSTTSQP